MPPKKSRRSSKKRSRSRRRSGRRGTTRYGLATYHLKQALIELCVEQNVNVIYAGNDTYIFNYAVDGEDLIEAALREKGRRITVGFDEFDDVILKYTLELDFKKETDYTNRDQWPKSYQTDFNLAAGRLTKLMSILTQGHFDPNEDIDLYHTPPVEESEEEWEETSDEKEEYLYTIWAEGKIQLTKLGLTRAQFKDVLQHLTTNL